ncbi:membrane-bound alpha-1,6- mannosyltransferase Initiation-specific [Tulasnella sp. 332]|nr:membrane-bound alpha-1,6- mannosyltransferase Initiation-specific [Tulasnella sp. 332]
MDRARTLPISLPPPSSPISKHAKVLYNGSQRWRVFSLVCYGLSTVIGVMWYTGALSARQIYNNTTRISLDIPVEVSDQSSTEVVVGGPPAATTPSAPSTKMALSKLGISADESFALGSTDPVKYTASLTDFIYTYFPPKMQKSLTYGLAQYFPKDGVPFPDHENLLAMVDYQNGWQTDKRPRPVTSSWRRHNLGWKWEMLGDAEAEHWVKRIFSESLIKEVWNALPAVILKADMLRYLLLLVQGGVYTDVDTSCLKPIVNWGASATLWHEGRGWLVPTRRGQTLESMIKSLGPPSVVVGVEADVGGRADWNEWYARPVQIIQWTLGSTPSHPILLDCLSRIANTTQRISTWSAERDAKVAQLRAEGSIQAAEKIANARSWVDPKFGGHASVMEWTGPGVFTDSVFRYLSARYNFTWPEVQNLRTPLRVGDVVVLPVTGFSPGVDQFGAQGTGDAQAMVHHRFAGSWKGVEQGWPGSWR